MGAAEAILHGAGMGGRLMWPFYRQVQLADMQTALANAKREGKRLRFCIPNGQCDTIQLWFDYSDPNIWQADDDKYTTFALGDEGLRMLADNGIYPPKETQ